jgi:hypothetical protein
MLDYTKIILQRVSFDETLFEKELRKSLTDLIKEEVLELKRWCIENFAHYHHVIQKTFSAK